MSQEYNVTPTKRPKNTSRAQRNRPVLVTGETAVEAPTLEESLQEIKEAAPLEVKTEAPVAKRRLPNFFSTLGKSSEESNGSKPEIDPAEARLARAARANKGNVQSPKVGAKETVVEKVKEPVKPAAKAAPAKPASLFKTRHIIGIAIYLLAANFVGLFETAFLRSIHADVVLTKFNLFGNPITISSSTLLFLATLVIILVLLAKFDFIPRSLGGSTAARKSSTSSSSNRNAEPGIKTPPPVIRPGVKGADDKLYESYRMKQRREKKR